MLKRLTKHGQKVNKSASNFKKNGCPYYPQLCIIFGDTTATSKHAHPSTRMPSDFENSNDEVEEIEVTKANDNEAEVEKEVIEKKNKVTSRVRRRGDNYNLTLSNLIGSFNENNKRKTDILELKLKHDGLSSATTIGSSSAASIDAAREIRRKCLKVVEEMADIDGQTYAKAFKMIRENLVWRETFLDVADNRKRDVITNL